MVSGYFRLDDDGFTRAYIDLAVEFHEPTVARLVVTFAVDTGADRTLLSPHIAEWLRADFDFDIRSLEKDNPIGGIGGQVNTRKTRATLYSGGQWITSNMSIPIIDAVPGPDSMPSLLGRDIIDYFALFMERRTERVLSLDAAEAEDSVSIPT